MDSLNKWVKPNTIQILTRFSFEFCHNYFKLKAKTGKTITTIRSTKYFEKKKVKIGDIFEIILDDGSRRTVQLTTYKAQTIESIPLKTLQMDANYPGFTITDYQDFADLLNSFTPYNSNRLSTVKGIYYLKLLN